ncbi:MAG: hypothetical protein P4L74_02125 [Candidatus Doudnabacteria bacterium]|nr:hypothetical protein [Candidatus Doudnabacteria bacterium]
MDELESQIAKIQLGNNKFSNSFIYVLAEKAESGPAEFYMVAEIPLLNPAAADSGRRICLAISSALKRTYRYNDTESAFENAVSQINDELGKLAALGQTQWVDKLSCIIGVKDGPAFHIATCGKVGAFLLRSGEFTDISCSPEQRHPLKTFGNYASGKLKLGDLLILSTAQLFNYLSLDRLLQVLAGPDFLADTQTIIELLKQNAEPQIGFGVLLNMQVPQGQAPETEVDLEDYVVENHGQTESFFAKSLSFVTTMFSGGKSAARQPQTALPKIGFRQSLKNWSGTTRNFAAKGLGIWQTAKTSARAVKSGMNAQNFRQFSAQKKFLIGSIAVLALAVIANIAIAVHLKKTKAQDAQIASQLSAAQLLLQDAQASLLYKDESSAANYYAQAKSKMPELKSVPAAEKTLYTQISGQLQTLQTQMEKVAQADVVNLGSLAKGGSLIALPQYLAVQSGQDIVSYNKQSGQISDGGLKSGVTIVAGVAAGGTTAAVYDGTSLYIWDYAKGSLGPGYSQSMPAQNDFGGMAYYPTNNRVYVADKKSGQVVSFLINKNTFSRPVVAIRNQDLSKVSSLAIDGAIYLFNGSAVSKYLAGASANFTMPNLSAGLSGASKIYAQKGFNNVYILDGGNNRILVTDKTGNLLETLESPQFNQPSDFAVDEAAKIIYVLNDGSLLKVVLP